MITKVQLIKLIVRLDPSWNDMLGRLWLLKKSELKRVYRNLKLSESLQTKRAGD